MVDVVAAEHHGVCPVCEGYGGGGEREDECMGEDSTCLGSCSKCWCAGCHDGNVEGLDHLEEDLCGSWAAYELLRGPEDAPAVLDGQERLL
jgi:hypothetical protein